ALGGQVVLSSAAADLVVDTLPTNASLVDLGYRELRDLARGEQVFSLAHPDLLDAGAPTSATSNAPATVPTDRSGGDYVRIPQLTTAQTPVVEPAVGASPATEPVALPGVPAAPSGWRQAPMPAPLVSARSPNFVGRDEELALLTDAWQSAST